MPLFNFSSSTRSLLSNRSLRSGQQPQHRHGGGKHPSAAGPRGSASNANVRPSSAVVRPPSGKQSPRDARMHCTLPLQSDTIESTPAARKVMRHISALGMEDPVTRQSGFDDHCLNASAPQLFQRSESIKATKKTTLQEHPSLIFDDMALDDLPQDMKSLISVASDHTATSEKGIDMQLFHSSLGHLSAAGFDFHEALETSDSTKCQKKFTNSSEESASPSKSEGNDNSQLAAASVEMLPPKSSLAQNGADDEIYRTLGESLQSLQSLSLEELQCMNSISVCEGNNSSRSLWTRPQAASQSQLHIRRSTLESSRLHQSYPRSMRQSQNTAIVGGAQSSYRRDSTSTGHACCAVPLRPSSGHKREWQAPPFVGSFGSTNDGDAASKSPPRKRSTIGTSVIPRRRRLPSIAQLFPDDGGRDDAEAENVAGIGSRRIHLFGVPEVEGSRRHLVSPHGSF